MSKKINLTVPDEMKAEMDQLEGVNWSKVAQEAFAIHIRVHKLKAEGNTMQAGIERLTAQKRSHADRQRAEGYAAGKKWALEDADFEQLERVASIRGEDGQRVLVEDDVDFLRHLAEAIEGDGAPSWSETAAILEDALGSKDPSDDRIDGFLDAVTEILDMVP